MNLLGLPSNINNAPAHDLVLIGLVAIQHEETKKWCATHETRGWYMPAGRIDYGEGIDTGAKREALEEAGVHVDLLNIIRIDFSPNSKMSRFRAIYQAKLKDNNEKLRDSSTADNEIIEACWVEPEELEDGRKVRTLEMAEIFSFLNRTTNTRRIPADFIQAIDGKPIDHNKVVTPTLFSITLIVFSKDHNKIGLEKGNNNEYRFISKFMDKPQEFYTFADKQKIITQGKGKLLGYSCLRYITPYEGDDNRKVGHLNVGIIAQLDNIPKNNSYEFIDVSDVLDKNIILSDTEYNILDNIINKQHIYPLNLINLEGMPLQSYPNLQQPNQVEDNKCIIS